MTDKEDKTQPSTNTVNGVSLEKFENDPPLIGATGYVVDAARAPDYIKARLAEIGKNSETPA